MKTPNEACSNGAFSIGVGETWVELLHVLQKVLVADLRRVTGRAPPFEVMRPHERGKLSPEIRPVPRAIGSIHCLAGAAARRRKLVLRFLLRSCGLAGPPRFPVTACNEEDREHGNEHPGEDFSRSH